jgi:hypothetical protein
MGHHHTPDFVRSSWAWTLCKTGAGDGGDGRGKEGNWIVAAVSPIITREKWSIYLQRYQNIYCTPSWPLPGSGDVVNSVVNMNHSSRH